MRKYTIEATSPASCRLVGKDIVNSWHLPLPISAEDAHALVLATASAGNSTAFWPTNSVTGSAFGWSRA